MKTAISMLTICMIVIFNACETEKGLNAGLKGKWVEAKEGKDTIDFQTNDSIGTFTLSRGLELRNGYMLPKYGSGTYDYKLKKDSIQLNNMLWNCICFPVYYFDINSTFDKIEIGNFYNNDVPATSKIIYIRQK